MIYPFVDVPRTLWGKPWWRAVLIAVPVWMLVFVLLTGIVDTVKPMREDAMAFLAPFMLYPFALAIAGLCGSRAGSSDVRVNRAPASRRSR